MLARRSLLAAALAAAARPALADPAAWSALRRDGVIALMRHADAPGYADPPGFRVEDCATQRNLSDRGRHEAARVGDMLRREGIAFARVVSSPWCRCLDTARLMAVGAVAVEPAFSNIVVLSDRRAEIVEAGRAALRAWNGPGALLVVTHGANIQALTGGRHPASGEIVVVQATGDGGLRELGRLPVPAG